MKFFLHSVQITFLFISAFKSSEVCLLIYKLKMLLNFSLTLILIHFYHLKVYFPATFVILYVLYKC